jgi:hypothetical protein
MQQPQTVFLEASELRSLYDYEAENVIVRDALAVAMREPADLVRFFGRYTAWNGLFGSGVAALAGKIGRSQRYFLDPAQPVRALADRSVFVASYFFDAARDEFDDRDTRHRDTHRCLAQALLAGVLGDARRRDPRLGDHAFVEHLLQIPLWLAGLQDRVRVGYGATSSDDLPGIFRAMGYHLGSEVLADQEFSHLDASLRESAPDLVEHLRGTEIEIAGQAHNAYQWLAIHSGHGGGAEADHFEWATRGVNLAFVYTPTAMHDGLRHQVHLGFLDFAHDHHEFFTHVNQADVEVRGGTQT